MSTLLTLQDFEFTYPEVPDLQVGMEQYNQFRFIRENHVFRAAQIGYRISRIDGKFQLGFGSLLHILDNAMYPVFSDIPRVNENPLIANESYKKWIYHMRDFQKEGPLQPWDEKYIFRLAGLNSALMCFKSEQKTNFRYITNLMDIPRKKESLTIINHNPLFRAYVFGKLKYYRKVQLILASVINTVLSLPVDKLQYIHIPISPKVFVKESFFKSKNRWDIASIKYPDSFHWIFMAHLLNFWDTKCNTSWFEAIPQDRWKDINFVLTVPGQDNIWNGLFINMGQIAELNAKNRYYVRLVNHLNTLASSGYIPIATLQEKMNVEVVTSVPEDAVDVSSTQDTPQTEEATATDEQIEASSIQDESKLIKVMDEHDKVPEAVAPEESTPAIIERITRPIVPLVSRVVTPIRPIATGDTRLGATAASRNTRVNAMPKYRNVTEVKTPVTKVVDIPVAEMRSYERVEERDTRVKEFIDAQEITPKQKERCERLALVYKDLTLNNRRVEDILTKDNDMSLIDNDIEALVVDLPDKSMKSSRITSFDEMYMKKTFTKDLVNIATSFSEQGMFLTDIEETPTINELTHSMNYKFGYEDYNGKKHTLRLSVPTVDKDGSCLINGTRKVLKKQMLTLPICQTSATRVSLSSNFNKTIVERNEAKSHSFLPFIIRAVELSGTLVQATYGNLDLNLAISYDYATLATKYRTIHLHSNHNTDIVMCFDYYNRYELLFTNFSSAMQDQVSANEKQYGICFAVDNDNVCGYVDMENIVTWVEVKKNTVIEGPTSIASVFSVNYPEDIRAKMGAVTEWTDLKILDKQFPIIFILGYRYGLTETLKHLGVKYQVIGKRTNEIYENITELNATHPDENTSVLEIEGQPFEMLPDDDIDTAMESLSLNDAGVPNKLPKYFHISPYDLGDAITMIAKVPGGSENFGYAEDGAIPRICVATAIDGAIISLRSVRFNKAAFRELGYVDMYVYGYDGPKDQSKIVTTEELTRRRLVFDAHVTQETWITENTRMQKIGAIRVYNRIKYELKYTDFDMQFNARKFETSCLKWDWIPVEKCTALPWVETPKVATEALAERPRYEFLPDDIVIKFKDCRLVINRYPLKHSLIVAGLDFFDTAKYYMEEFDQQDVYFSLLADKKIRINYLKGIDAFFQFFVDDITRDVLEQMNEPTNVRDLLIRSTELLTTLDHREASSMANHRIRSYEQFNAIIYNELSRQMASYMVRQGKGNVFSINPEAIYQRIIKNESFSIAELINPIHDIKEKTAITYSGMGGRTAQSFVVNDRRYPKDAVGIMSEATVDSGKVAINAFLTVDPSVLNTRGILLPKDPADNEPTEALSSTALLMPCATNDDQHTSMLQTM